jgi:hypothetical protein
MGADIAYGLGGSYSSYSALVVLRKPFKDLDGKWHPADQVMEFRTNCVKPDDFADLTVFFCKWFNNAYLVPEVNGPGELFVKTLSELGYRNTFKRPVNDRVRGSKRRLDPGYRNTDRGMSVLTSLENAIRNNKVLINSQLCLREMGRYFIKGGRLVHSSAQAEVDEAAKGKAHGDCAIATAMAWFGVTDWPMHEQVRPEKEVPVNCFLKRRERAVKNRRSKDQTSYWMPKYG